MKSSFSSFLFCSLLCSCIVLPDPVGVGSSGAVLGMLASWIVWILFRWFVHVTSHHIHPSIHSYTKYSFFSSLSLSQSFYVRYHLFSRFDLHSILAVCGYVIHIHTSIHSFTIVLHLSISSFTSSCSS